MLVIREFCHEEHPLVLVDEGGPYKALSCGDSEGHGKKGLIDLTVLEQLLFVFFYHE